MAEYTMKIDIFKRIRQYYRYFGYTIKIQVPIWIFSSLYTSANRDISVGT